MLASLCLWLVRRAAHSWEKISYDSTPHMLSCYHLGKKMQVTKMLGKICKYSQDMSLQFLEFSKPNSKCAKRNKKINCYVNSVIFIFFDSIHVKFVFFVSLSVIQSWF
jgi:hypothetical protein